MQNSSQIVTTNKPTPMYSVVNTVGRATKLTTEYKKSQEPPFPPIGIIILELIFTSSCSIYLQ